MALFEKKTKENKDQKPAPEQDVQHSTPASEPTTIASENIDAVLSHPRLTEKATRGIEGRVYTFDMHPRANKIQVKKAIEKIYKVTPVKVNVSKIARKSVRNPRTGEMGVKGGGKKAMVYLKKGDSISIV